MCHRPLGPLHVTTSTWIVGPYNRDEPGTTEAELRTDSFFKPKAAVP